MKLDHTAAIVRTVTSTGWRRPPPPRPRTLWDIATDHPTLVKVVSERGAPARVWAHIKLPRKYVPNAVSMLCRIPGAYFDGARKVWVVPAAEAQRLSDVMDVVARGIVASQDTRG